jgi:alcohol dehydrogenase class IV
MMVVCCAIPYCLFELDGHDFMMTFPTQQHKRFGLMNEFRYTAFAQEIIFGVGALAKLGDAVVPFSWKRLLLCTSPTLRRNGTVEKIEQILGDRLVATFDEVSAHVQEVQVAQVLEIANVQQIDAVIGLGGGSPVGMAKAVSMRLEALRTGVEAALYPTEQPLVPSIAIPTTYAGSEMTPTYGVTQDMGDGSTRKVNHRNTKVPPKLVIYDPALTLDLPPAVTGSTGINGLAHCIEAVYSISRNPLSTASALLGIQYIHDSLLRCVQQGDDLEARTQMLIGANLGGQSLATSAMGIHHGTCQVLGGTAGVPHGVANSIILPHAIRFNLDTIAPLIAQAGEAMGISRDGRSDVEVGELLGQAVYNLVGEMGLPQRLRDAGVAETLLPKLAENMLKSKPVNDNPKPVTSVEQAETLLRAAW